MKMTGILAVIGVCGLACSTFAQSITISVRSSVDGGVTWHETVDALSGQVVQVGLFMSGDGVYGFAGADLRLMGTGGIGDTAAFASGTDTGRVGPFNDGDDVNAIYATSDGFRIDSANDPLGILPMGNLSFMQRAPAIADPASFSTANPALCFRFDVTIGSSQVERTLALTLDQLVRDVAYFYANPQASRASQVNAGLASGSIHVIPGPATPAMIGLVGLAASRRRAR